MSIFKTVINNALVRNIFLAIVIVILLVSATMWWLKIYTHHGEAVTVPDIKGLQMSEAAPFLERAHLRYEIVDSIHVKNAKPGSIVEVIPTIGSKVKINRIIFITVNSFSVETITVPEVKDLSQRQALVMLKTLGFENIAVKYVPSPYKELVVGLEYNGREVRPGEKIPIIGNLVLKVSSGEEEYEGEDNSVHSEEEKVTEDSWF